MDDIFDKLDFNRVKNIVNIVNDTSNFGQLFISDTDRDRVKKNFKYLKFIFKNFQFMKRTFKTKRMESMIDNFLNQKKISDGIFNVKINEAWKNSVGNKIYKYTKSIYYKNGKFFIQVDNPILKQEIIYSKGNIIKLLNEEIKQNLIKKIILDKVLSLENEKLTQFLHFHCYQIHELSFPLLI